MHPVRLRGCALVLAASSGLACTEPRTEVVVTVRATVALAALRVTVRDEGPTGALRHEASRAVGDAAGQWRLPLSFGLLPADPAAPRRAWVEAVGCASPGSCVGGPSQRALITYRRGQTLALDLWITGACEAAGARCLPTERCAGGACEPASRADAELRPHPSEAGPPPLDAADVNDADDRGDSADVNDAHDGGDADAEDAGDDVSDAGDAADVGDAEDAGDAGDADASLVQRSCLGDATPGCGLQPIAGGTFTIGAPRACARADAGPDVLGPYVDDGACAIDGAPETTNVTVSPFAIDRYEVTVARYRVFWGAYPRERAALHRSLVRYPNGSALDLNVPDASAPYTPLGQGSTYNWTSEPGNREQHPINGVSWWHAMLFCAWDGGRLPTEAEWEFVARAWEGGGLPAGRVYALGDGERIDCSRAAVRAGGELCNGADGASTHRVGSFPGPDGGVFDLVGNVGEWTADEFTYYGAVPCWAVANPRDPLCAPRQPSGVTTARRVIRGGTWSDPPGPALRAASRASSQSYYQAEYRTGFRCARSL